MAVTVAKGDKLFSIQPDLTQCRRICYACERLPANRSVLAEVLVDLLCDLRGRNPGTRLAHRSSLQTLAVGSANGVHPGWAWHSPDDAASHPKAHAPLKPTFGTERDLPLRRSSHVLRPTAALLLSAGFLVGWLPPIARGFRPVLARGWHGYLASRRSIAHAAGTLSSHSRIVAAIAIPSPAPTTRHAIHRSGTAFIPVTAGSCPYQGTALRTSPPNPRPATQPP